MTLVDPAPDVKNFILSFGSGALGFLTGVDSGWLAIVLPCIFFTVGKTADIILRLYLEKRKK